MIPRLIEARPLDNHRLFVRFADGVHGEVDLTDELWGPVFEPLKEPASFREAVLDVELNTVRWPSGADLAPEYLYEAVKLHDSPR